MTLEVRDVSLAFGGITALDSVSFDVPARGCFGLIGPNGAGKTALLNCVSGVYRPSGGRIVLNGSELLSRTPEGVAALGVGRTFQSMEHFSDFRVSDYLMLGRARELSRSTTLAALAWPSALRREARERRRADEILELCGLSDYRATTLAEVPYGTQKLVDMARVLCAGSEWALLDEPTSGTTSGERPAISAAVELLVERGTTVVVVDHDVDFVTRHAGATVALDRGRVIAKGPTQQVLDHPAVREIYLGLIGEREVDQCVSTGVDNLASETYDGDSRQRTR